MASPGHPFNFLFPGAIFQRNATIEEDLHCFSMAVAGKTHLEHGDKVILPSSMLNSLLRQNVQYPMLFRLTIPSTGKVTHCSVSEFTSDEGTCNIPFWMQQYLFVNEGDLIRVTNVALDRATFVKFRPLSTDFLSISNPQAVLTKLLRNYSALTQGGIIRINYNSKNYDIEIREVKPNGVASIIEADFNIDFEAPPGYEEPTVNRETRSRTSSDVSKTDVSESKNSSSLRELQKASLKDTDESASAKYDPFGGKGVRLDGKSTPSSIAPKKMVVDQPRSVPQENATTATNQVKAESKPPGKYSTTSKFRAFSSAGNKLNG